ncbi:DUF2750 domain-containing protein [Pseudomonas sp. MWU13-3659]|uniref:DUF2750 domain-containing protein n=1 Tax=Pseudomonas sp. MWU13-3659 TaxID=2986964 RepID=UPI00207516B4|nr:DUF2750 domain-containing protein [Pseudomonas sp. MWU13-3659]
MHDKKLKNISSLMAEERLGYFVRKVSDFEQVWGLYDDGWATSGLNGKEVVPFWPEKEFAELCAKDEWKGFSPCLIPMSDFLNKWLPGMHADSRLCQIFPVPSDGGVVMTATKLEEALREELEQYE